MKETNTERPATGPARKGLEMAKHPLGLVPAVLGNDEDADEDGNDTGKGPKHGGGLLTVSKLLISHNDEERRPSV